VLRDPWLYIPAEGSSVNVSGESTFKHIGTQWSGFLGEKKTSYGTLGLTLQLIVECFKPLAISHTAESLSGSHQLECGLTTHINVATVDNIHS